jgi:hypothetical protein
MSRIRNIGGKKTHAHGPFDRIISKWASFYSYLSTEFSASFVTGEGLPPEDEMRVGVTPITNYTKSMTVDFLKIIFYLRVIAPHTVVIQVAIRITCLTL